MRETQNRGFAEFASDTDDWFERADALRSAAEMLESSIERYWTIARKRSETRPRANRLIVYVTDPDPRHIYLMLMAYAIENLCKGLQIAEKGREFWAEVAEMGKIPRWILGHDVRKLLQNITFPLSTEDRELADRLTRAVVWSGRYPVPPAAKHWSVFAKTVEGKEEWPEWHREEDVAAVKDFYARVDAFVSERWREV